MKLPQVKWYRVTMQGLGDQKLRFYVRTATRRLAKIIIRLDAPSLWGSPIVSIGTIRNVPDDLVRFRGDVMVQGS